MKRKQGSAEQIVKICQAEVGDAAENVPGEARGNYQSNSQMMLFANTVSAVKLRSILSCMLPAYETRTLKGL